MQRGVVFPQPELAGARTSELRRYAENIEGFGYRHLLVYDHVLGADPERNLGWTHKYTARTTFREPFVFFGFLAAATALELVTGVLVLPQRQTALVAKQAAEVDLLTDGQFRLGVGVGWNRVEYEVLGMDFTNRGRRIEEQVGLLGELWVADSVTFEGTYEQVRGAAIAPLPLRRPLPIWMGAQSAPAYRRAGRLADGWFPHGLDPNTTLEAARAEVRTGADEVGRNADDIGMEARIAWRGSTAQVIDELGCWESVGATHVSIDTTEAGLADVDAHLTVLADVAAQLPSVP
jgi:probable F420-dependent oxidoreductase